MIALLGTRPPAGDRPAADVQQLGAHEHITGAYFVDFTDHVLACTRCANIVSRRANGGHLCQLGSSLYRKWSHAFSEWSKAIVARLA